MEQATISICLWPATTVLIGSRTLLGRHLGFRWANHGSIDPLGQVGVQNVHGTLQIELASNIAFENVIGGSGNDSLTGNGRANLLQGNGGDDLLQGDLGNDVYRFQADSSLGNDVINDLGGLDTLDFSLTLSDLQLDLGARCLRPSMRISVCN